MYNQDFMHLFMLGSTISTQLMSSSNTIASAGTLVVFHSSQFLLITFPVIDTGNESYPEPFTQDLLSGRNEAVMTDSGISTSRATSEASQLTVRCSTVCGIMSVCFFDNIMIHCFFLSRLPARKQHSCAQHSERKEKISES